MKRIVSSLGLEKMSSNYCGQYPVWFGSYLVETRYGTEVPFVLLKVFSFKVKAAPLVVFGVIQNPDPKTVLYMNDVRRHCIRKPFSSIKCYNHLDYC